jgi:hypothetical protein
MTSVVPITVHYFLQPKYKGNSVIEPRQGDKMSLCRKCLKWHGIVVIASAYRTEDPGFESRQGVRFFRNLYTAVLLS